MACLLHADLQHLDSPDHCTRVLFIDFSCTTTSRTITINTEAPQGCVLGPFLYTFYTNDSLSPSSIPKYFQLSDLDTATLGLLTDRDSVTAYQQSVTHFTQWCIDSHPLLNVTKKKEQMWSLLARKTDDNKNAKASKQQSTNQWVTSWTLLPLFIESMCSSSPIETSS